MHLIKRSETYYVCFRRGDKWIRKSLGTKSVREAKILLAALKAREGETHRTDVGWADLVAQYIKYAEVHRSKATIESRLRSLCRFEEWTEAKNPVQVTLKDCEAYKIRYLGTGVTNRTVNESLSALKAIWALAYEQEWLREAPSPWRKVKLLPEAKTVVRFLDEGEVARAMKTATLHSTNQLCLFALGIFAGLRKGEAVACRWEWFDWKAKVLQVQAGHGFQVKDREDRAIPISEALFELLRPHVQRSGYLIAPDAVWGKSRYRFEVDRGFKAVCRSTGISIHPHTLRHTFASRHAQAGVNLYKIAKWMGHSNTLVTERYGHLQPYDADIDRAGMPMPALTDDSAKAL